MLEALDNLILNTIDPGISKKIEPLKADEVIENYTLNLVPSRQAKVSDIVKNGPLLLTFIRGTWCPFCNIHLKNLRNWVEKLRHKKGTIIVVSSEEPHKILNWLDINPTPYIFASDPKFELADYFGVRLKNKTYFQAATFLIDTDLTIRLAYTGKRSKKLFKAVDHHLTNS